jgi:hypothetical protein
VHNYTFSITRESDSEFISFPFSFDATIQAPASEIWEEWTTIHTDYEKCWLWPIEFSQPSVEPCPPEKNGLMTLTYQIPNPHNPKKPKKNATYQFHLLEWDDEDMKYAYRATVDHPFLIGGGSMEISVIDENSCRLHWQGLYKHVSGDPGKEAQGDVFAFFLGQFFTTMAQNIKKKVGV